MRGSGSLQDTRQTGAGRYHLDETDRKILALLTADARLSTRALAREIGMSPGAVSERVSRLEDAGVILGYHAEIDPSALGFGMDVLIGAQVAHQHDIDNTVKDLLAIDEVQTVHLTTGSWGLVIGVRVRDHRHLREIIHGPLSGLPNIERNEAMIILDTEQRPRGLPGESVPAQGHVDGAGAGLPRRTRSPSVRQLDPSGRD
jgi:DNA-binding Lrp family transcriptional regulator